MIAEMFWERRVVFMEGRPPSSTGLPSLPPAIRRCAPRHFNVGLALSKKAGGMGLVQEAVPYLNLGGLQLKVNGAGWALDAKSMAAGMC